VFTSVVHAENRPHLRGLPRARCRARPLWSGRALNAGTKQLGDASDNGDQEREHIRDALVALIAERGYSATTLEAVLGRAAVDRATFEAHFSSLDEFFTEIWRDFTQQFVDRALAAHGAAASWREGMRAQAWVYCRFLLQEDHVRARICMIELAFAGEIARAVRDVFMNGYVELMHLGRLERPEAADTPRARGEAIVGAIWERMAAIVKADAFADLPKEMPQLLYVTVLPYLGLEVAQEELRRGPEDIARYQCREL
jgi:AcrR family transcriptional regulator